MKTNNEHHFLEQKELIDTLSLNIISNLEKAILEKGKASLIVSGGSTPKPLFEKLSSFDIAWDKVKVALCDERWINSKQKDSNEKLVKDTLLNNFASKAEFISMYQENIDIEDAQDLCSDIYKSELFPFDVLILGMGNDGHTASLFPNNIKLEEAFETNNRLCICMTPKDAPYERMSLSKKAILSANNIYLHFEGEEKQKIYKKVLEGISSYDMPIAAILNQDKENNRGILQMNEIILEVTQNIIERSKESREIYLSRVKEASSKEVNRSKVGCSNLAHTIAPMSDVEKELMADKVTPNIAIVTAYNDMLSAHEPFSVYPSLIKRTLLKEGATAQVASGVPAMCDGVTQGFEGMELSLLSRDNIAMGAAIGLSHNVFDGAIYLGVCDKIVPGLLIGALSFGHLPAIFMPAGPMPSGISNKEKAFVRQEFAQGKVDEKALFKVEAASYHSSGTCTFYGTANSNQMLLEMMGLQLPNSSFVNANTHLRDELTQEASKKLLNLTQYKNNFTPIADIINEKSFVNAIVGLMATGGSTNHTIHLIAMARAAGITLNWDDFNMISKVTPLLCKLYPNGSADVNHFRDAGGMSVVIHELINAGLVHEDVNTIVGHGLRNYIVEPELQENTLVFKEGATVSRDKNIISSVKEPFSKEGGITLLEGNLGRSIIKTSALKEEHLFVRAPAMVFSTQNELKDAFKNNLLNKDFVAVVKYQGPKSNGMPELHGLLPALGVLQDKGYKVAIVTDGRMSGASGKVPSAIHLVDEAAKGGMITLVEDGDMICLDVKNGTLNLEVAAEEKIKRIVKKADLSANHYNYGRNLFSSIRSNISTAEEGATIFDIIGKERLI